MGTWDGCICHTLNSLPIWRLMDNHTWQHLKHHVCPCLKEWVVWKQWWYNFTLGVSLRANLYMNRKDQVFIANVVVTNSTWKTVALSVINQPSGVAMELNAIVKIYKYWWLHEGHHFIPMAMEVHDTRGCDMDWFIKECVLLFYNK